MVAFRAGFTAIVLKSADSAGFMACSGFLAVLFYLKTLLFYICWILARGPFWAIFRMTASGSSENVLKTLVLSVTPG
jgi:hypothetical protein